MWKESPVILINFSMSLRPACFTSLTLGLALACLGQINAQTLEHPLSFDPLQLQTAFGTAEDLQLINKVADIPPDGYDILKFMASKTWPEGTPVIADFGGNWSSSDNVRQGQPQGQHRFTAVNDQLLAIVYVVGGFDVQYKVILAPRNSKQFCLFDMGRLGDTNFRVSIVQYDLRPDRDQGLSKTPVCMLGTIEE